METENNKRNGLTVRESFKVSCFGAGYVGGPTMTVMANKCPQNTVNMFFLTHFPLNQIIVFRL